MLANEKFGLSNVALNSLFSIRGFLKSIYAGFAPVGHLIGPYGYGADDRPNNKQLYSRPSGQVNLITLLLSPIV